MNSFINIDKNAAQHVRELCEVNRLEAATWNWRGVTVTELSIGEFTEGTVKNVKIKVSTGHRVTFCSGDIVNGEMPNLVKPLIHKGENAIPAMPVDEDFWSMVEFKGTVIGALLELLKQYFDHVFFSAFIGDKLHH